MIVKTLQIKYSKKKKKTLQIKKRDVDNSEKKHPFIIFQVLESSETKTTININNKIKTQTETNKQALIQNKLKTTVSDYYYYYKERSNPMNPFTCVNHENKRKGHVQTHL